MSEVFNGIVFKSTGSQYLVKIEEIGIIECAIKGKLRIEGFKSTNPVAVGDSVQVELMTDKTGIIKDLNERKNYIIRKSSNLSKQTHILASNVDQAMIMATLVLPETPLEFIDRFLAVCEAYAIPSFILLNKSDLYTEEFDELITFWKDVYKNSNYPLIEISVTNNMNIGTLSDILKDKTTLIAGNSGVGKSSLIQKLCPDYAIRIGEISDYHLTGKHTTTFAEMFELPFGGKIIDTPGIKGFGLVKVEKNEIYHFFPEIFQVSKNCQYNNCLHINEPKCAVIEAVNKGEIHWSRYKSYLSIMEDTDEKYR